MDKHKLLQKELKGLDVEWFSHMGDGEITHAMVNGNSIIWHQYAFCDPDKPEVEVYFIKDDNPTSRVPIKGLRELVK